MGDKEKSPEARFVSWSLALFAVVLVGLGTYTLKTQASSLVRIAKVEATINAMGPIDAMVNQRLTRIEGKIDRLIERSNK